MGRSGVVVAGAAAKAERRGDTRRQTATGRSGQGRVHGYLIDNECRLRGDVRNDPTTPQRDLRRGARESELSAGLQAEPRIPALPLGRGQTWSQGLWSREPARGAHSSVPVRSAESGRSPLCVMSQLTLLRLIPTDITTLSGSLLKGAHSTPFVCPTWNPSLKKKQHFERG